jgi:hypothetical protein
MRQLYRRPVRITGLQMDSLSLKVRQQRSNCSSVIDATACLPEKLNHPVRDLYARLPWGNIHHTERVWIRDNPALHDP